jgi:hypothetical protein
LSPQVFGLANDGPATASQLQAVAAAPLPNKFKDGPPKSHH